MSTRQFLPQALRQCRSSLAQSRQQPKLKLQQQKNISTTPSKEAGLRQLRGASNASQQLSQLGDDGDSAPPPNELLHNLLKDSHQRRGVPGGKSPADAIADLRAQTTTDQYAKMMPRFWDAGSVYAPRDLGAGEAAKWSDAGQFKSRKKDNIAALGINPLDNYRNFSLISEFMTPYGRIMGSDKTGLSPVNQRKMAKTIRRAIGLGIHPSVHYHPELLIMRHRGRGLPQAVVPKDKRKPAAS